MNLMLASERELKIKNTLYNILEPNHDKKKSEAI